MPIFYFKVTCDGQTDADPIGLQLLDLDSAWDEATATFGELIRDAKGLVQPGKKWAVEVLDEQRNSLRFIRVWSEINDDN